MRVFLAVDLPEPIREGAASLQKELAREQSRSIRWLDPAGIHLTLRFLGEVSVSQVERLREVLGAGIPLPPFSVRIGNLGIFPRRGSPRILWVGFGSEELLHALALWVEERVISTGFPAEPRPFHPHLTLGRFRSGSRRPATAFWQRTASTDLGEMLVEEVVLFQSHLEPRGARYDSIQRFPLSPKRGTGNNP